MAETGKDVLIVDDEEDSREFIKEALSSESLSITCAIDGEEGLRRITEDRPDLVILDVHMPKIDGFQVLKALKCDPKYNFIPVIMLTTETHPMSIQSAQDSGANAYLIKPINPETFQSVIKKVFG